MDFFIFHHSEILWWLLVIPVLAGIYIVHTYVSRRYLNKLGNPAILKLLMPDVSSWRPVVKFIFILIGLSFIILSLADKPEIAEQKGKKEGVEIMIALDISNSMMAEDIKPSRLFRAKQLISRMVDELDRSNNIGLIVFAGDAFIQLPITSDYVSAKMFLESITPALIGQQGTAIGKAINLALHAFTPNKNRDKVLIIISDGEDHEQNALETAALAEENNVIIHTIGMGSPKGAPVPDYSNGKRDFKRDLNNNVIISKLNQKMLAEIAATGNGKFFAASNMEDIYKEINAVEKYSLDPEKTGENDADSEMAYFRDRFLWFAGIALFFLLIDFVLLERKNKLFANFNLFKIKV